MHDFDQSLRALFNGPICPHCATAFDPKHYDFVEDRACCSNCGTLYLVGDDHVPDIPADDLDVHIADPEEDEALKAFRADAERIAIQTGRYTAGASYALYARQFSEACDPLLNALDPALRASAIAIAKYHGYFEDHEAGEGFGTGCCSLTGIDENCCHCGRHS